MKKAVPKNFAILTGKHLCWSFFLRKLMAFRSATLLKKSPRQVFYCEFCKVFKSSFFEEQPRTASSVCNLEVTSGF